MMKLIFITLSLLLSASSFANANRAWTVLKANGGNYKVYPRVIENLVNDGLYFTSIPYVKEYLFRNKGQSNRELDKLIDEIVTEVGIKQFEVLPTSAISSSTAPMLKYIYAKKLFRKKQYSKTLKVLNKAIPRDHAAKPFALFLEASAFSLLGKTDNAVSSYKRCVSVSNDQRSDYKDDPNRTRQLEINRDYCIVGVARTQFAAKKFEKANLSYLDLEKSSYIWPEILFEEAWNSFYLRDYNRTLGKLVTYKAPVLDFIFNPEIDVLRALTYMELCLWNDTRNVVDGFYKDYTRDHSKLKGFLRKHRKDYKYYYLLMKSYSKGTPSGNKLLDKYIKGIRNDPAYREMFVTFSEGRKEIEKVKKLSSGAAQRVFLKNLKDSLVLQRDLLGAYVRKGIKQYTAQLNKAFEGMSYIKLEVLARRKAILYNSKYEGGRSRGDIRNLKRNEKQYFWNFNGEFWADELGDYVFSLKSECK